MGVIDNEIRLNFTPESLRVLNLCLAFIMYGIALDLRWADFVNIVSNFRSAFVGVVAQFILLPMLTFFLVCFFDLPPSIALGMILVGCCPGGNISNFMSYHAGGNLALSVTLTSISTVLASGMTPLNFFFWSGLLPETEELQRIINLDIWSLFQSIFLLIGLPLIAGVLTNRKFPAMALKMKKSIKIFSLTLFTAFVLFAFFKNRQIFLDNIHTVFLVVLVHNLIGLSGGYILAKVFHLNERDARTISLETGIQNSGLALIIVFNFFGGLGGMALVAAWWGIWHIISGLIISTYWSFRPVVAKSKINKLPS